MANYMIDLRGLGTVVQLLEEDRYHGTLQVPQTIAIIAIAERLEVIASALEVLAKEAGGGP